MRIGLLFPLVMLTTCARQWVRDYDGVLPGTQDDEIYATWVVDAETRAPLPGATLRIHHECIEPYAEIAPFVAEFRADRHGMIVVPWEQRFFDCHWVYDHPGYAAQDKYADIPEVVELERGRDVRGRIVDAPAGIEVEYFLGCLHSPAVRRARTGADGRFVIHDADPEYGTLWAVIENRVAEYFNLVQAPRPWPEWEAVDPEWGVNASGRVVDEHGEPVAGVVVYSEQTMRGPRTVTDEHGYFDLDGLAPDAEVEYFVPDGRSVEMRIAKDGTFPGARHEPELPVRRIVVTPPGAPDAYTFWLGYDEMFEAGDDGRVVVATTRTGPLRLRFSHEEYGWSTIDIPPDATTIGPDAFPVQGTLIVLAPDGKPATLLDEEAVSTRYRFRAGARVRLHPEDRVPVTRVLKGESPFVVQLGDATLVLHAGGAEWLTCCLDSGIHGTDDDAVVTLRGLDPGPHRLLVGARGRRSREVRVVLRPGETRRLDLALPPS